MNRRGTFHTIDSLFTFLLLLAFLLFALLLAGTGSAVYRKSADSLNANYTSRTALSYLAEKLRQHDRAGSVEATQLDGLPALALHEEQNGDAYLTYIYFYDGALRELFTRTSTAAVPDMGSAIAALSDFSFTLSSSEDGGQILEVSATDKSGQEYSELLHLSSFSPDSFSL